MQCGTGAAALPPPPQAAQASASAATSAANAARRRAGRTCIHFQYRPRPSDVNPAGVGCPAPMSPSHEHTRDALVRTLTDLVELHSPSGVEAAVDTYLLRRLHEHGRPFQDGAGNVVLRIEGRDDGPLRSVLAHKDEIGGVVKRVNEKGQLAVSKLGGSYPWIWGEGPVDVHRPPRDRHRRALVRRAARLRRVRPEASGEARGALARRLGRDEARPRRARRRGREARLADRAERGPQAAGAPRGRPRVRRVLRARRQGRRGRPGRARGPAAVAAPPGRARVHRARGDRLPRRQVVREPHRRRGGGRLRGDAGGGGVRHRRRRRARPRRRRLLRPARRLPGRRARRRRRGGGHRHAPRGARRASARTPRARSASA